MATNPYSGAWRCCVQMGKDGAPIPRNVEEEVLAAKIARAMASGPYSITKDATVAEFHHDGTTSVLRKGTNHWVCFPGDENQIGNVPMCCDPQGLLWVKDAIMGRPAPSNTAPGLIYMLCGANQHSSRDVMDRTSPAIPIGPHWMILWPYDAMRDGLPNTVRDDGAWVMFDGTPYAHLHICGTPWTGQEYDAQAHCASWSMRRAHPPSLPHLTVIAPAICHPRLEKEPVLWPCPDVAYIAVVVRPSCLSPPRLLLHHPTLFPHSARQDPKCPLVSALVAPLGAFIRFGHVENRTLRLAHQRLGPVIRVAPNELSISNLDCVRTVYQGGFSKPPWYSVFDNYGLVQPGLDILLVDLTNLENRIPCMFSIRRSRDHSLRKRMISSVYSKSFIQTSAAVPAQDHAILIDRLLPTLRESILEGGVPPGLDVYSLFFATAMDFIAAYVFGLDGGTNFICERAYREHWLELYKSRSDYGIFDQELPTVTTLCRRVGIPLCPSWVDAANRELGEWCRRLCDAALLRRSNGTQPYLPNQADQPVVMDALLAGLDKQFADRAKSSHPIQPPFQDLAVASELFDHVLAGQETAGITMTYLCWRLSQFPGLQRELRAELLTLHPTIQLSEDGKGLVPDPKQLDVLPLLHAILMETLRLHAPIPGPQPRQTPWPFSKIGGYLVPGGVRVAALAHTLHRDSSVFPEPDTWDHTRWLSAHATEEEIRARNRQFWAFGSGGRMCIGSNFAMHEMKMIVASIYSNFTTHIVNDDGVAEQGDGYTARPAKEQLYLRFEFVK